MIDLLKQLDRHIRETPSLFAIVFLMGYLVGMGSLVLLCALLDYLAL